MIITKLQVAPVELDASSQSSSTCRASRVRRVEPVELDVSSQSSESSCALRLARHSQNAWARHVECVESSRVEPSGIWAYRPIVLLLMVSYGCWYSVVGVFSELQQLHVDCCALNYSAYCAIAASVTLCVCMGSIARIKFGLRTLRRLRVLS